MRLLFVADGRSPIALNWMAYFAERGHEVHLASTFACDPNLQLASLTLIPVAFSHAKAGGREGEGRAQGGSPLWGASLVKARTALRQWLGPFTLPGSARRLRALISQVQPDILHAMRIPFEGMLAAEAVQGLTGGKSVGLCGRAAPPLLISVWGNDFTLHAVSTPWMARATRLAMREADALHTDCRRDLRLAHEWGFSQERPAVVLPGGGGVQLDLFFPPAVARRRPVVINPRGFRAYVRNDTFFRAIPQVLAECPESKFLCPAMAGEQLAARWSVQLGIDSAVDLLPAVPRGEMAELFRRAQVAVSPTVHDGTPNTLLEAMACGCFPVAGDGESLREWIENGVNGFLVDPADPQALAAAILEALNRPDLRRQAEIRNRQLIEERGDYRQVMETAEGFYRSISRDKKI